LLIGDWLLAIGYWLLAIENSAIAAGQNVAVLATVRMRRVVGRGFRHPGLARGVPFSGGMTPQELRRRTAAYAADVSRLARPPYGALPARDAASQLTRSAASAAANYRAACVARSHAEFRSKISVALEECDESVYWMEHLRDSGLAEEDELTALLTEGRELTKILGASKRTSHERSQRTDNHRSPQ
jgi:four helix bundle protein